MLPPDLTEDITTRLKSITGQISGIIHMLENDEYPDKILIQFKAAQSGLDKAHYLLLDEVYRKALAIKIVETVNACPGNCGNEDKIEFIRKQFPTLALDELTQKMKEITALNKKLKEFKDSGC
ncbi:MAG: metal-sensitive transcriptional regulator [Chitinophagaceae bacterium]